MRVPWGEAAGLLATVLCVALLAACSGSKAGPEAVPPEEAAPVGVADPSWAEGANAACRRGRGAVESAAGSPGALNGGTAGDTLELQREINRIGDVVAAELRALPLPVGREEEASQLVEFFVEANALNEESVLAAERHDLAALNALIPEFIRVTELFDELAAQLDATECMKAPFEDDAPFF